MLALSFLSSTSLPDLLSFAAVPSLQDLVIFIKVASTLGDHLTVVTSKLSGSQPRLCLYTLKEFAAQLLGLHAQQSPTLVFVTSTCSSQAVSHPRTIQAQCCLTSVFKWELVFPTWNGPLTLKFVLLHISDTSDRVFGVRDAVRVRATLAG